MRLEIIYLEHGFRNSQILSTDIVFGCVSPEADAETKSEYKQFIWEVVSGGSAVGRQGRKGGNLSVLTVTQWQVTQWAMAAWSCQAAVGGRAEHALKAVHQEQGSCGFTLQVPPSSLRPAPGGAEPSGR